MPCFVAALASRKITTTRWNANAMDLPIQHIVRSIFIALNMFPNIASSSKEIFKQYSCLMWFPVMKDLFDSPRKQRFLMHLCGQNICAINSNAFSKYGNQLLTFIIQSYLNHLCIPNLLRFKCGHTTICTTIRPVAKGEQLFQFYLGHEVKERGSKAIYLDENFGLQCKCEKCLFSNDSNPIIPSYDSECHHILVQFCQNELAIVSNECKELRSELKSACIHFLRKYGSAVNC